MTTGLSTIASLLGDPGRAAMALSLMDGRAIPAGELARTANVAPQTASGHLVKLVEGGLLSVENQGRHRYYRLANSEVAYAIEALLVLSARAQPQDKSTVVCRAKTGSLAHARTCYSHLAGWVGVQIAQSLEERSLLVQLDWKTYTVTPSGNDWFAAMGIDLQSSEADRRRLARRCLDWTERKYHLAGALGCELYRRLNKLKWVIPIPNTRSVRVTVEGKSKLWDLLRIPIV